MMCKHEWVKINEHTTESKLEQMDRLKYNLESVPHSGLNRLYITDYACNNCGKLKRFKESI